jgi:hypothetical protein
LLCLSLKPYTLTGFKRGSSVHMADVMPRPQRRRYILWRILRTNPEIGYITFNIYYYSTPAQGTSLEYTYLSRNIVRKSAKERIGRKDIHSNVF